MIFYTKSVFGLFFLFFLPAACSADKQNRYEGIYVNHKDSVDYVVEEKPFLEVTAEGVPLRFPLFLKTTIPDPIRAMTFSPKGLVVKYGDSAVMTVVYEDAGDIPFHDSRYTAYELYSDMFEKGYSGLVEKYSGAPGVLNGLVEFKAALELDQSAGSGVIRNKEVVVYFYINDDMSEAFVFNKTRKNQLSRIASRSVGDSEFRRMLHAIRVVK